MKKQATASAGFAVKSIALAMVTCQTAGMLWLLSGGLPAGMVPNLTFGQWLLALWCLRFVVLIARW